MLATGHYPEPDELSSHPYILCLERFSATNKICFTTEPGTWPWPGCGTSQVAENLCARLKNWFFQYKDVNENFHDERVKFVYKQFPHGKEESSWPTTVGSKTFQIETHYVLLDKLSVEVDKIISACSEVCNKFGFPQEAEMQLMLMTTTH